MKNIILIASSCGMVAFGFLAYMQAEMILHAQHMIVCYSDVGFTDIWITDIILLIASVVLSTLCFNLIINEVTQ